MVFTTIGSAVALENSPGLAVELANRERRSIWREFLRRPRERGLAGVELVVSYDRAGLRQAIREILPAAAWQRCYVGLLKNVGECDLCFWILCLAATAEHELPASTASTARRLRSRE